MPKVPFLIALTLLLAGCDQSARETATGGYPSYGEYLRSHQTTQVPAAQSAPVMTEDGTYGDATTTAPSGSIGADTLAALKATAPGAAQ